MRSVLCAAAGHSGIGERGGGAFGHGGLGWDLETGTWGWHLDGALGWLRRSFRQTVSCGDTWMGVLGCVMYGLY